MPNDHSWQFAREKEKNTFSLASNYIWLSFIVVESTMQRFLSAIDETAEDFAGVIKSACRGKDDEDARRSKHSRGRPRTSRMMTQERVQQAEMNQMRMMMMMSREYSRAHPPMHHPPTRMCLCCDSVLLLLKLCDNEQIIHYMYICIYKHLSGFN